LAQLETNERARDEKAAAEQRDSDSQERALDDGNARERLNSIRPTKRIARENQPDPALDKKANPKPTTDERPRDRTREIPEEVRRRFTQVGNQFYFPDGTRAFTDRGSRITSPSENSEVIKSLIAIAQARGWTDLTIRGTERFRRDAWFAGRQAGLDVRGYRPSGYDEARLARTLVRAREPRSSAVRADSPATDPTSSISDRRDPRVGIGAAARRGSREREAGMHVGRLADHGAAHYRHDSAQAMSYFVRLETSDSEREIWGVDLHRALKESLTKPQIGDEIALRAVRRDSVTLQKPMRDKEGNIVGNKPLSVHRNRWIVEQRGFFKERAQAARLLRDSTVKPQRAILDHPELAGTFLKIRASELAAKAIRDPEDRRRFVATVRRALADEVARGEPLTPVRLKATADRQVDSRVLKAPQMRDR
jgi:hypothetical protein